MKTQWKKLDGTFLGTDIVELVENTIIKEQKSHHQLKICVGSDSQVYKHYTAFATAVVFLRQGKGGFMYINRQKKTNILSLKERMLLEVYNSIDVAYKICYLLDKYEIDLEVHADINTNPQFKSNVALSDAMGYIMSMGFEFKAKPNAFAGSSCADRVV